MCLAAAEARPGQVEDLGGAPLHQGVQHGGIWQRYEEKVVRHRLQLDSTKAQLDEAVRKLNDMQVGGAGFPSAQYDHERIGEFSLA